jgi:membrane associated rhomboid family serine protease
MVQAPVGYQCPSCIEQARAEIKRGSGPQRVRAIADGEGLVTKAILLVLIAMYAVEVVAGGAGSFVSGPPAKTLFDLGAMFPPAIADGQYWRLMSATILHAGILHIGFNAYALWIFGPITEQEFGRGRFLAIYLVAGFVASATSYTFGPVAQLGVGASGAIVGIFGAFIAYNFRRRDMPLARARLRMAFTLIVLNALISVGFSAVDWRAHLGGLVAGFIAGFLAEVGPRKTQPLVHTLALVGLCVAGIAMVLYRTNAIHAMGLR